MIEHVDSTMKSSELTAKDVDLSIKSEFVYHQKWDTMGKPHM
jgi:hypothetical protein